MSSGAALHASRSASKAHSRKPRRLCRNCAHARHEHVRNTTAYGRDCPHRAAGGVLREQRVDGGPINCSFQHASWRGARPRIVRAFARSGLTVQQARAARQFGNRSALWSSVTPNLFRAPRCRPSKSLAGFRVVCVAVSSSAVYAATSSGPGFTNLHIDASAAARRPARRRPTRTEFVKASRRPRGRRGSARRCRAGRRSACWSRGGAAAGAHLAELVLLSTLQTARFYAVWCSRMPMLVLRGCTPFAVTRNKPALQAALMSAPWRRSWHSGPKCFCKQVTPPPRIPPPRQRPAARGPRCASQFWCKKSPTPSKRNTPVPDAPSVLRRPAPPGAGRRETGVERGGVHANWLPSTTRRRARCRGTVAPATRTTSTHISSRSRSHKWQP